MATTEIAEKMGVKHAAQVALNYLRELIPHVAPEDASLEEVELDGDVWLITLGFTDPRANEFQRQFPSSRIYKQFTINAFTGDVLAMKIREP